MQKATVCPCWWPWAALNWSGWEAGPPLESSCQSQAPDVRSEGQCSWDGGTDKRGLHHCPRARWKLTPAAHEMTFMSYGPEAKRIYMVMSYLASLAGRGMKELLLVALTLLNTLH